MPKDTKFKPLRIRLREFLFADDAAFVALSEESLQIMMDVTVQTCKDFGMELSRLKTEVMIQQPKLGPQMPEPKIVVKYDDDNGQEQLYTLKVVNEFKYLGVVISNDPFSEAAKDVNRRIQMAAAAYGKYKHVFNNKYKPLKLKVSIYKIMVLTTLLQCIGVRCLMADDVERLESFHYRKLRSIRGWKKDDFKSHEDVYEATEMLSVKILIKIARISWWHKVQSMPIYRVPKLLMDNSRIINTTSIATRRVTNWSNCFSDDMIDLDLSVSDILHKNPSEVKNILDTAATTKMESLIREKRNASEVKYLEHPEALVKKLAAQMKMKEERKEREKEEERGKPISTKRKREKEKPLSVKRKKVEHVINSVPVVSQVTVEPSNLRRSARLRGKPPP